MRHTSACLVGDNFGRNDDVQRPMYCHGSMVILMTEFKLKCSKVLLSVATVALFCVKLTDRKDDRMLKQWNGSELTRSLRTMSICNSGLNHVLRSHFCAWLL